MTQTTAVPEQYRSDRRWLALSAALVIVPVLVVRYPPAADLPQHVAQARLLDEALHSPTSPYKIMWLAPYSAFTALVGLLSVLVGPVGAGRTALAVLGLMWVGAVHWLAARRGQSPESAVLASMLFLGYSLNLGFCTFLLGWPLFLAWLDLTARPPDTLRRRDLAAQAVCLLLLYVSHGLWWATAVGWLLITFLVWRRPWRLAAFQLAIVAPMIGAAALWWTRIDLTPWGHQMRWNDSILTRLTPRWLSEHTFGGLHGPVEHLAFGAISTWCVIAVWQHRRNLRVATNHTLLLAAALFLGGALLLPSTYSSLYYGAERFLGPAVVLLVLALPAPRASPKVLRAGAVGLLAVFCGLVALSWRMYETTDLTGLDEALAALPSSQRLLGLDFMRTSAIVRGRPFEHLVAYGQAMKGGSLAYSFAEGPEKLVLFKDPDHMKWTRDLQHYADRVQPSDLRWFDYVLVAGEEKTQAVVADFLSITPVTNAGLWRLYKVKPEAQGR